MNPVPGHAAEGAAFPPLVKLLAVVLVAANVVWGWRVSGSLAQADWNVTGAVVLAVAVAIVLWCASWIVRSRTRVDATCIHQSWMWDKSVPLADITEARLVGVPGLSWIIAPRLVLRARGRPGVLVFHAADQQVLGAFAALCLGSTPFQTSSAATAPPERGVVRRASRQQRNSDDAELPARPPFTRRSRWVSDTRGDERSASSGKALRHSYRLPPAGEPLG